MNRHWGESEGAPTPCTGEFAHEWDEMRHLFQVVSHGYRRGGSRETAERLAPRLRALVAEQGDSDEAMILVATKILLAELDNDPEGQWAHSSRLVELIPRLLSEWPDCPDTTWQSFRDELFSLYELSIQLDHPRGACPEFLPKLLGLEIRILDYLQSQSDNLGVFRVATEWIRTADRVDDTNALPLEHTQSLAGPVSRWRSGKRVSQGVRHSQCDRRSRRATTKAETGSADLAPSSAPPVPIALSGEAERHFEQWRQKVPRAPLSAKVASP